MPAEPELEEGFKSMFSLIGDTDLNIKSDACKKPNNYL